MSKQPQPQPVATPSAWAWNDRRWLGIAAATYALLTLAMFADVLFTGQRLVSAEWYSDIRTQFYHVRGFGFGELARGNLPLWNPHIFAGAPFAANFQSALFYPPNWLFLVLPTAVAINWSVALHVFFSGFTMFVWLQGRRLHPLACLTAGVVLMFSGPYFAYTYAGNLSNICTMAWAPLILFALDGLLRTPTLRRGLFGAAVVALQILAGHPQYVYYTAVAAGLYFLFSLPQAERKLAPFAGYLGIYFGGAALAAIQLIPGLASTGQSVRAGGVPYEFALHYSLPPENLLTFFAPNFFGEMALTSYWGRGMLWEMTGFFGLTGLALAIYGAIFGARDSRRFVLAAIALVMLVLALGGHTPLFRVLYHVIPGFGSFRGTSKFLFLAVLFLVALAAVGLDTLFRQPRRTPLFAGAVFALALALWIGGVIVARSAEAGQGAWWADSLIALRDAAAAGRELYHNPPGDYVKPEFVTATGVVAAASLQRGAVMVAIVALFLLACAWEPRTAYVLAALAAVEVLAFARPLRESFPTESVASQSLREFLANQPPGFRIINQQNPNEAMTIGALDVLGYDPGVSKRYAELLTYADHRPLAETTQYLRFHPEPLIPSVYRLARARYLLAIVKRADGASLQSLPLQDPLPLALLVNQVKLAETREDALSAMTDAEFDPRRTVILEHAPTPSPDAMAAPSDQPLGAVRLIDQSTDHMTLEADLRTPAVLLITDVYDSDWRAVPLEGSTQQQYEVLPADWAFRGIPLSAGNHRLRLEYAPAAFLYGATLTGLSLGVWIALVIWSRRRTRAI